MRKILAALLVAVFVAPAFAGEKKAKSQLPAFVQVAFQKHLKHLQALDVCKQEGSTPCSDRLIRVVSGREAGHSYGVTGHAKTGVLPAELYADSNEYNAAWNLFGQGMADDGLVVIASTIIHEVCHGLGAVDPECYGLQVQFLQGEAAKRPSAIVDRVIGNHLAHIQMCQAGNLPGCERQISSATPAGVQTAAQR